MPWVYSVDGGTPPTYTYSQVNTLNQHCAKVNIPSNGAITQLKVYAAGRLAAVSTRLVLWSVGGAVLAQSSTFSMAQGTESGGGQAWQTKSITAEVVSSGNYWVGLYRNPTGGHIFGTVSSGEDAYRKTNTSGFPSVQSMSGYSTHSGRECYVGAFYITAPDAPSSCTVSRVSDSQQNVTWSNNSDSDQPYDSIKVERWNNISSSWSQIASISGSSTSYNDTTTTSNRQYRYRVRAYNSAGYSSYSTSSYIRTTPASPSSVVATRVSTNVQITWNDNATAETSQSIYRNTSSDGVSWAGYSLLDDTITTDTESYIDTSPANYNYYKVSADCTDPTLSSSLTESNQVIVVQPPEQPSGLSPTGSEAFDSGSAKDFSWTHNPNDGTSQEKFSLHLKKSSGTYPKEIDNFSDYSEWTSADTLADDTTNVVTGLNNSVKIADSDDTGSTISMDKSITTIDLTEFDDASASDTSDLISFLVYISDKTLFNDLTLKLGDDASNYYYSSIDPSSSLEDGWNRIDVAKSAFSSTGSPTGWDDITYVRFDVTTENNASAEYISFQYLQLAKVTDFTSYAGTKFVQFNEIESSTESLSIDADTFINGYSFDWVVKTWGEATSGGTYSDGSSDFSDTSTIVASETPTVTITDPTAVSDYGYSSLSLDWDYSQNDSKNQTHYIAYLYDSSDTLLETIADSSNIADGESDTATFENTSLENGETYTVKLKVKSSAGLWSELAEVEFDVDFFVPATPTFSLELDESVGGVNITIVNPSATPPEIDAVYNRVYRQVDSGEWELAIDNVDLNTTVTDYIPSIGGNTNYYVQAVSAIPSVANSSEDDIDILLTGYFFLNGGDGYGDYIKLSGDISIDENRNRQTAVKKYHGRTYGVKKQSANKIHTIKFSCNLPKTDYDAFFDIVETVGNHFFRDWNGRYFEIAILDAKDSSKDQNNYSITCLFERVDSNGN